MRILHVIPTLDARFGGPAVAMNGLARAQAAIGLNVSIVAHNLPGDDPSTIDSLRRLGVTVELLGPPGRPLSWPKQIADRLNGQLAAAQIIHIHALWEEIQHRAARGAGKTPYIFRPCGMLDPWSLRQSKWKKKIYMSLRLRRNLNGAAALHFTTDIERDLVAPLSLKPRSIVEPNGVDLDEFANLPTPGTFRQKYPIMDGRRLVVFMSRVHPKKGLDLLIPAFGKLRDREAILAIVGPDADGYQGAVEAMIDEAEVRDRVICTGLLRGQDRLAALADADLFVLPSYQENFGVAVVEALAAGTPVIISDQVNLYPDVLAGGVGEVVPTNVEELAAALDRWLSNETLRKSAAAKAGPFAKTRYDWRHIALRWKEHYAELLGMAT